MNNQLTQTPSPHNEPVRDYAPGSDERRSLQARLRELKQDEIEIPAVIGGEEVKTGNTREVVCPHDHGHTLAHVHLCGEAEVERALDAAMTARATWGQVPWDERAAIFLRAADLLAGPWRDTLNASSMLGQSKTAHQAEIDSACELIDFLRFNVHFMEQIYQQQPNSSEGIWNRMQYRPLEGFVFAVTPFNFTSIQGNLPTAPAMLGNAVIWKPSTTSVYSAHYTYKLLEEAGLPPGVINMVPGRGANVGDPVLASPHLAGLHFTGSEGTFQHLWQSIGNNIDRYHTFPRIVGETGGKDFIAAHESADPKAVATAITRGSFEYQGQKCSAASRLYLPASLWPAIRNELERQLGELKIGSPDEFTNFISAVIDAGAFEKITGYIDEARRQDDAEIVFGGDYDDDAGYFIEPTVIRVQDPKDRTMREEIFGPLASVYVYEDDDYAETLHLIDETSPYALTGGVFGRDRSATRQAMDILEDAAGNFYINDKPTGAVVGQQPFGGARRSGTNDKAGSILNLMRWVSARSIKENLNPPTDYHYPFHQPDVQQHTQQQQTSPAGNGRSSGETAPPPQTHG